jgi:hypothetical protein
MTTIDWEYRRAGALTSGALRGALALGAGLVIGLAASSLFGLAVLASGKINIVVIAASIFAAFAAGSLFSVLLSAAREEPLIWVRVLGLGLILPVVGTFALLVPIVVENLVRHDPQPVGLFRVAFVAACTVMATACTAIACWMFGIRRWIAVALKVGVITGLAYLVVALALDPIPGLHVGGGNMAMPKVAAICNFIAGLVGGTMAHVALSHRG